MPKRILITGAGGFAGSHLVDLLAGTADAVVAWHRPGRRPPDFSPAATTWDAVDVCDRTSMRDAIERAEPDLVYHCAGAAHVGRSWGALTSTLHTNVRCTQFLLDALRDRGHPVRVLIPGSAMVYKPANEPLVEGHPLVPPSPYGFSKLAQELVGIRSSVGPVSVAIGRAFNHTGPRQDPSFAASGFAKQIAEIEAGRGPAEVVVGNLDARRDIMDVRDTVRAYRAIADRGHAGRPYNICTGRATAIGELLDLLRARARTAINVRVDAERFRPNDQPLLVGDATRLHEELGWSPVIPLSQTLDDLLEYWRGVVR